MLPSGEKEKAGETLLLQNTSRLDSGTYICGASNGVENPVDAKIKLKVICKYQISEFSENYVKYNQGRLTVWVYIYYVFTILR